MTIAVLFLVGGVVFLYFGAEWLVKGSASVAFRAGVSPLVVGLTIVAFGTSAPELVVSMNSGLQGLGNLAVGNVVGSNIFNIAVILGISAMISPLKVNAKVLRVDTPLMLAVSCILVLVLLDKQVSRIEGILLFAGILSYTFATVYYGKKHPEQNENFDDNTAALKGSVILDIGLILAGLAFLVAGSHAFVKGAVIIAKGLGVSEALIGLTIVAAGTSLPELATSVVAAFKKQADIAIGNIVGSNLFNILSILGLSAAVCPLSAGDISWIDLLFMCATAALLLPLMRSGFRINRIEGALLFASYMVYLFLLWPA